MVNRSITNDTPIAMLTVGQLKEFLGTIEVQPQFQPVPIAPTKRYVYGQKGVAEIFGCSIPTASRILASGKITGAVSKIGRCIVVDVDKALELAKHKEGGRKWRG
jgi:hypothetical protein